MREIPLTIGPWFGIVYLNGYDIYFLFIISNCFAILLAELRISNNFRSVVGHDDSRSTATRNEPLHADNTRAFAERGDHFYVYCSSGEAGEQEIPSDFRTSAPK